MFVELNLIKHWLDNLKFRSQFFQPWFDYSALEDFNLLVLTLHDFRSFCRERVDSASDKTIANPCFRGSVLVCSGSYEKIPATKWAITTGIYFLRLEFQAQGATWAGSRKSPRKSPRCAVSSHGGRGKRSSWGLFPRSTHSVPGGLSLSHLPALMP